MAGGLPSTEPRPQTAGVQDRIVVQPVHNQTLVSVRAGPRQGERELPRGAQARLEVRGPSSQPAARPPPPAPRPDLCSEKSGLAPLCLPSPPSPLPLFPRSRRPGM